MRTILECLRRTLANRLRCSRRLLLPNQRALQIPSAVRLPGRLLLSAHTSRSNKLPSQDPLRQSVPLLQLFFSSRGQGTTRFLWGGPCFEQPIATTPAGWSQCRCWYFCSGWACVSNTQRCLACLGSLTRRARSSWNVLRHSTPHSGSEPSSNIL
jgi:hypothetical protein